MFCMLSRIKNKFYRSLFRNPMIFKFVRLIWPKWKRARLESRVCLAYGSENAEKFKTRNENFNNKLKIFKYKVLSRYLVGKKKEHYKKKINAIMCKSSKNSLVMKPKSREEMIYLRLLSYQEARE